MYLKLDDREDGRDWSVQVSGP